MSRWQTPTSCVCPDVFLIGNHELYNWSRDQLREGVPWEHDGRSGVLRFCPEGVEEFWSRPGVVATFCAYRFRKS